MPLYLPSIADGRVKQGSTVHFDIPGVELSTVSTQALSANLIRYMIIRVVTPIVIDQLICEVTSQGTSGQTARMAIYNCDGDQQPTSLIVDGGTVAVDTQGVKTASVSVALSAAHYLMAINTDSSATFRIARGGSRFAGFINTLGSTPFLQELRASFTYGAFPAAGVAHTANNNNSTPPNYFMWLRVSMP